MTDENDEVTFVTDDSALRGEGVTHEVDDEILRQAQTGEGLIELTPELLEELSRSAAATVGYFQELFAGMEEERAAQVLDLRANKGYSWRAVAQACNDAWGGSWGSNQLAGMAICEAAADYYGENFMEGRWN